MAFFNGHHIRASSATTSARVRPPHPREFGNGHHIRASSSMPTTSASSSSSSSRRVCRIRRFAERTGTKPESSSPIRRFVFFIRFLFPDSRSKRRRRHRNGGHTASSSISSSSSSSLDPSSSSSRRGRRLQSDQDPQRPHLFYLFLRRQKFKLIERDREDLQSDNAEFGESRVDDATIGELHQKVSTKLRYKAIVKIKIESVETDRKTGIRTDPVRIAALSE
ncbi:hypothetical protein Syun_030076 [Stephania yunnanensis]|uniref:Uncharacterized protein n=1 Tax=Stephania yunnanensis TaxID=152371 RepID=A0AAP0EA56_9MAGN